MPQAANITVKKNDGTTDVIWTLQTPSGGDGVAALWRNDTVSGPIAVRPTLTSMAKWNGPRTVRQYTSEVTWPEAYTETTTGLVRKNNVGRVVITGFLPPGMDTNQLNELVSQAVNLFASTLHKDSMKQGYAPT